MRKISFIYVCLALVPYLQGCENLDNDITVHEKGDPPFIALEDVAGLLSEAGIGDEHIAEVHGAVSASADNGYDEEYMMRDLFREPGSGVGDSSLSESTKTGRREYDNPLRDLLVEHLRSKGDAVLSKSSGGPSPVSVEEYVSALETSDIQIYWPFSEQWDGKTYPVITFDPADGSSTNTGYLLKEDESGEKSIETVVVTEEMAQRRPVWVVNRNDDASYTSIEMLRKQNPEWDGGGGSVVVRPFEVPGPVSGGKFRTLILKDFTMLRNYDPWFAGASEFFVKIGSVEDFTASTEAELRLYSPSVTDFMITVKRKHVGEPRPFNAVLVSEWTDQLDRCALMITEDDGGTRTSWKCTAVVKISSKSYGVEINLPFNTKDDIVWRGQLSSRYIFQNSGSTGHFGDVDLTFEVVEY